MIWLLFASLSAFAEALRASFSKTASKTVDPILAAWALGGFSVPFMLPFLFFIEIPEIGENFWPILLGGGVIDVIAAIFFVKSIQKGDLSVSLPLLSFLPVFMLGLTPFINNEVPSAMGLVGVLVIVAGSWALQREKSKDGWLEPLKALVTEKSSRYMLITAMLWSINASLHKVGIQNSSALFWPIIYFSWFTILFSVVLVLKVDGFVLQIKTNLKPLLGSGFFTAIMLLSKMVAFNLALAVYVAALGNLNSIFAVLLGALVFGEKEWKGRLLGVSVMVSGVLLISFS